MSGLINLGYAPVPATYSPYVQYFASSGVYPTSYFGNTTQSYKYGTAPGEPWPTTLGIPVTLVRNLGVWSPGDGLINYPFWGGINTSDGVYDWSVMDTWMTVNQAKSVDVIFVMFGAPSWTGGSGTNPTPTQVTNFYSALATRYAGKIKYYEGWNEFNGSFSGTDNQLVAIQQAMYQAVKAADPACLVISYTITGLYFGSNTFWNNVTNAGGKNWFDIAAFHSYGDATGEAVVVTAGKFRAGVNSCGLAGTPIFDTEGAWQPDNLSDATEQAAVVMKQHILEYWMGVSRKVWYAWDGATTGRLVDGQATSSPTLDTAGTGHVTTVGWITGASIADVFRITDPVWYGDLTRAGGYRARVIWASFGTPTYTIPGTFTQYRDYTNTKTTGIGSSVTLGLLPILLENHDP